MRHHIGWMVGTAVVAVAALLWWILHPAHPTAHGAVAASDPSDQASETPTPHEPPRGLMNAALPAPPAEPVFWQQLERLELTDKEAALAYALEGERWYSSAGSPAEARRAKIISLLVDLDRMTEARRRTRQFIDAYPTSRYRPLVQGMTGIHPRPGPPAHLGDQGG